MKKMLKSIIISTFVLAAILPAATMSFAANQQLVVDLSSSTGALQYGATGFLYGLGNEGIPSDNMLAALRPNSASQKPHNGKQHPNGDAFEVANEFKRTGGKQIQIILQDIYLNWPYENLGINDYVAKVDTMVREIIADPNRCMYVYVPFNEPDGIWYNESGTLLQTFFSDWKTVYQKIRSIDSTGKIAGPSFSKYNASAYSQFMTYAKANNCLPDIIVWHELGAITDWYSHYNNFRSIETSLGLPARPISINEYGRITGSLGVPGNLVQYIARFENSKVDGNLAYWTNAGALNDLATENNKATGGWWLYKWYGEMTGNGVTVTPPTQEDALQGIATLDSAKKQARIVFGGSANNTDVVVKGFGSASYLGSTVHAIIWGVNTSGLNPSTGPYFKQEGDYPVSGGQIIVPVTGMVATSAYQMIVTPNLDASSANNTTRYEAEYAKISGSAKITYGTTTGYSGTYYVEGYGGTNNASTNFVVTAAGNGFYNVTLRYSAGPYTGAPANRTLRMVLNGDPVKDVTLPGTANWNTWGSVTTKVFLTDGINRIAINAFTNDDSDAANVDYIDVVATTGTITSYEAEAAGNTRSGIAVITNDSAASGGKYVGYVGGGAANTLQINNVNVPTAGLYRMVVTYANGELGAGATNYNTNVVDRYADVSTNGGSAKKVYFRNTLGWSNYRTTVIDVNLNAGNNTIKFSNSSTGSAPNLDKIEIAAALN